MRKLSESERKTLMIWGAVAIIIFIMVITIRVAAPKFHFSSPNDEVKNYAFVLDRNRYYTVNSAILKYYSFINAKDKEKVLSNLNQSFIEEKNITVDNITEQIAFYDISVSFKPDVMCYKDLKAGITSYLVKGNVVKMNVAENVAEQYFEVILNGKDMVYNLQPITKEQYEGECHA